MRPEERASARSGIRPSDGGPLARLAVAAGRCVATVRRFDRAPTCGARFGLALGDFRKEPAARQGAGKPVSRFGGSSQLAVFRCCAFRSARERASSVHLPGIPANAVGGGWNERSAESVTRTREVRAVVVPKGMRQPVGWVRSFRRTSLQPAWIARRQQRGLRRRLVLRGRGEHCRQTAPQDAGAARRWQGRDVGAVGPYRSV